jgi:dTMP kinase
MQRQTQSSMTGKLIVLYGINNLGKSTQARLLVDRLKQQGLQSAYLKYGLYDLEPSGPLLNEYLRHGNPHGLSAREFQLIHVLNRTQYQQQLQEQLAAGHWIVGEDYLGTGISWGIGAGIDRAFLERVNSHLLQPDIAFLFQGKRFLEAREHNHKHETDDELMARVAVAHEELGRDYNWLPINANDTIDNIHEEIWRLITERFQF